MFLSLGSFVIIITYNYHTHTITVQLYCQKQAIVLSATIEYYSIKPIYTHTSHSAKRYY